jgi:hypothetical protein
MDCNCVLRRDPLVGGLVAVRRGGREPFPDIVCREETDAATGREKGREKSLRGGQALGNLRPETVQTIRRPLPCVRTLNILSLSLMTPRELSQYRRTDALILYI